MGGSYLIVVDAHSKWPEVHHMSTTTTTKTIQVLRSLFARYGIPEQLVSDNGPQFVSEEFGTFMKRNGVKHIKCFPYHPSSNGLAEQFVLTFKQAVQASREGRHASRSKAGKCLDNVESHHMPQLGRHLANYS